MAEVAFVGLPLQVNGDVYSAGPMATGDTTSVLALNDADSDVCVHVYGTAGGATVTIACGVSSVVGNFAIADDAYGTAMVYTALPVIKPLGPAARQLQGSVAGGAGSGIFVDVYVTHRRS
jgi:hypothetical protein